MAPNLAPSGKLSEPTVKASASLQPGGDNPPVVVASLQTPWGTLTITLVMAWVPVEPPVNP